MLLKGAAERINSLVVAFLHIFTDRLQKEADRF